MSGSLAVLFAFGLQTSLLLVGSFILFSRDKSASSVLQLLGATFLMVVVLAHVAETSNLFPWMGWGLQHSAGHYLDFGSAVLGLTFFPIGYLWHTVTRPSAERTDRSTV
jgi:hypothetical protein